MDLLDALGRTSTYLLDAVVLHKGGASGGHYTAMAVEGGFLTIYDDVKPTPTMAQLSMLDTAAVRREVSALRYTTSAEFPCNSECTGCAETTSTSHKIVADLDARVAAIPDPRQALPTAGLILQGLCVETQVRAYKDRRPDIYESSIILTPAPGLASQLWYRGFIGNTRPWDLPPRPITLTAGVPLTRDQHDKIMKSGGLAARQLHRTMVPELVEANIYAIATIPSQGGADYCSGLGHTLDIPQAQNDQPITVWEYGVLNMHTPARKTTRTDQTGCPIRCAPWPLARQHMRRAYPEDCPALPPGLGARMLGWYRKYTPLYLPRDDWPFGLGCIQNATCICSKCALVMHLLRHDLQSLLPALMAGAYLHRERVQLFQQQSVLPVRSRLPGLTPSHFATTRTLEALVDLVAPNAASKEWLLSNATSNSVTNQTIHWRAGTGMEFTPCVNHTTDTLSMLLALAPFLPQGLMVVGLFNEVLHLGGTRDDSDPLLLLAPESTEGRRDLLGFIPYGQLSEALKTQLRSSRKAQAPPAIGLMNTLWGSESWHDQRPPATDVIGPGDSLLLQALKEVRSLPAVAAIEQELMTDQETVHAAHMLHLQARRMDLILPCVVSLATAGLNQAGSPPLQQPQRNWLVAPAYLARLGQTEWLQSPSVEHQLQVMLRGVRTELSFSLLNVPGHALHCLPRGTRWWVILLTGQAHLWPLIPTKGCKEWAPEQTTPEYMSTGVVYSGLSMDMLWLLAATTDAILALTTSGDASTTRTPVSFARSRAIPSLAGPFTCPARVLKDTDQCIHFQAHEPPRQ
jgi:hypothetical protein